MRYDSPIGGDLVTLQRQMAGLPDGVLQQYVSQKHPINSLPAGIELSRRAKMQQEAQAVPVEEAENQPTVVDSAAQQLGLGSLAPQPAPAGPPQGQPMPPPQMAQAPQPQQRPPMLPPQMAQAPQPQGQPQEFAKGGIIAFNEGGGAPFTDVQSEQSMIRQLEEARNNALSQGDQAAVATIDARIASLSGGRYSPPPAVPQQALADPQIPRTPQDIFKFQTTQGPMSKAYQDALATHQTYLENRVPAGLDEKTRNELISNKFSEFQKISAPFYKKQEGLLAEEQAGAKRGDIGNDALLRFGLGLIGKRRSDIGAAGISALDYYDRAKQAEAEALKEARKGEMALLRSRMADERGDRTAAQTYADKADQSAIRQQKAEDDAKEAMLSGRRLASAQETGQQDRTASAAAQMYTADENRKSREQTAADTVAQRKIEAQARAQARADALKDKPDPVKAQQVRFIEDRINTIDKALAKIDVIPSFQLSEEQKINKKKLEDDRAQLEKGWGNLVGYALPTTSSSSSSGVLRRFDAQGKEIK